MATEIDVQNMISKLSGSGRSLGEFIGELFKDKFIEIYLGDAYENVSTEQIDTAYPAVICGKVVGAYRECLVINAAYIENRKLTLGNILFINERAIRFLTEINGKGTLEEVFLRSRESATVKQAFDK